MGNRELRTMLRILRECGVQSFESGELKVTFAPVQVIAPLPLDHSRTMAEATPAPEPPQFEDPLEVLFYHEAQKA